MTISMAKSEGYEQLGATLDALRGLWGVSEVQMAQECGVSRPTLQNRFRNVGPTPRADELERYVQFFGVPAAVLVLPAEEAVVAAIRDYNFLARKPIKKRRLSVVPGGGDGGHVGPGGDSPDQGDVSPRYAHLGADLPIGDVYGGIRAS